MSQDPQENMQVLHHWFNTVNENDKAKLIEEARETFTEDYMLHDPGFPDVKPGLAGYLELLDQVFRESADLRVTVDDMFGFEDRVVTRAIFEYTDLKANEHRTTIFMVISRFVDGKLAEEWEVVAPIAAPST